MKSLILTLVTFVLLAAMPARGEDITIAAASDMKFALEEIVQAFKKENPKNKVDLVFGASGKMRQQIEEGAPFDIFFSADINFPKELYQKGFASTEPKLYAVGHLVLWSSTIDVSKLTLKGLDSALIKHIAVANPKHAPYGQRAEEALRKAGVWETIQPKLVFGDNISQAAQFAVSGNAEVGIIALSLALSPEMSKRPYAKIAATEHAPLEQGFIITKRGGEKPLAKKFADYVSSSPARRIMINYGFALPGEKSK